MTFMVYMFALSIFFFMLKSSFIDSTNLDVNAELLFLKLENSNQSFLQGAVIDKNEFHAYIVNYDPYTAYEFFRDFDNLAYSNINYCVFLERNSEIIKNFAAFKIEYENYIYFDSFKCGEYPNQIYFKNPNCNNPKADSIILSKPVLYDQEIIKLKVLICAEKI